MNKSMESDEHHGEDLGIRNGAVVVALFAPSAFAVW
jgi:hypothetical protein